MDSDVSTNTPGILGYVAVYLVAVAAVGTAVVLTWGLDRSYLGEVVAFMIVGSLMFVGPPAAVVVALVHLVVRRVRSQTVHVLVAGVLGLVAALVVMTWANSSSIHGPEDLVILESRLDLVVVLVAGLASALGRAAVIPLVHRRRRPGFQPFWERDFTLV